MNIYLSRLITVLLFIFSSFCSSAQSEPLLKWQKTYGTSGTDIAYDVVELSSGGYIIVGKSGDYYGYSFAIRVNEDNTIVWEKYFGGSRIKSVIQTSDGNILMAVVNQGVTVTTGSSTLIKIDLQGTILWTKSFENTKPSQIRNLIDGSITLVGEKYISNSRFFDTWIIKIDFQGNIIWEKNYGGNKDDGATSVDFTKNGGFIVSAYTQSANGDVSDNVRDGVINYWILKLDSLGNKIWDKKYGGSGYYSLGDTPYAIRSTYDKGSIVVGEGRSSDGDLAGVNRLGNPDFWVIKLDSLGQKQWSKTFGGSDRKDVAYSVEITKDSNYVIGGISNTQGVNGVFNNCTRNSSLENFGIIKVNKQGNLLWKKCMGGSSSDECYSMKLTSDDGFIMVGQTNSTDGDITQRFQYNDIWVVKLDKECNGVSPIATANPSTSVCKGEALNLSSDDLIGARYSWKGPNSFNSTSRTPSIPNAQGINEGTYSVTVAQNGCSALATTNVKVGVWQYNSSLSNEYQISTNSPVCINKTITFSINTLNNSNYFWSGPNSFSSTLQNPQIPNVTPSASGIYTVTLTSGNCIESATKNVVVDTSTVVPTFTITNNTPTWEYFPFNLSINVPQANYYTWKNPLGQIVWYGNPYGNSYPKRTDSGTYSVEIIIGGEGGCTGTATTEVIIVPSSAIIATSNSPQCNGNTLQLSAPQFANMTYIWSGPNSFSSTLREPQITNISNLQNGVYTVKAFLKGYYNTATTRVLVNPTPTATSNSPICAGYNLNLSVTETIGATYSWIGPNSFTSTLRSPTITNATNLSSGNYSVSVSLNGCTATSSTSVIVNQIPNASIITNSPICEGKDLNLSVNATVGATYSWTGVNGFSSTLRSPTISNVTNLANGNYVVRVSLNGCEIMGIVSVLVKPQPTATITTNSPICAGSDLNLSVTETVGATYSWTGANGFTSNLRSPIITNTTNLSNGNYSVIVFLNGCTATNSTSVIVSSLPTATITTNSPVCTGADLNLSSSEVVGATYSWTGANRFTSTLRNPVISNADSLASGSYILYVEQNGCSLSASTTVSVKFTPKPQINSNSPVCVGNTLTIYSTETSDVIYSWAGPNNFTSSLASPILENVNLQMGGVYTLSTYFEECNSVNTIEVSINSLFLEDFTSFSNFPICEGGTLKLSATEIFGASYNWSGPNNFSSDIFNPTIENVENIIDGTYSVFVNAGGCTKSASNTVTVNLLPQFGALSNSPVCKGDTLRLLALEIPSAQYLWYGPHRYTSSSQSSFISNVDTLSKGWYELNVLANGCDINLSDFVDIISIPPISITSNSPVCVSNDLFLSATELQDATYSWIGPNNFISTLRNPILNNVGVVNNGNYLLTTSLTGCSTSSSINVTVTSKTTTIYSLKSGNWEISSTWICGNIPDISSEVLIKSGHIVELDSEVLIKKIDIEASATLKFLNNLAKVIFTSQ